MSDDQGVDYKILCVAVGDPHQAHVKRLKQIRPHRLVEIENFFRTYKLLEDKTVDVVGWHDADRARDILREDREVWRRDAQAAGATAVPEATSAT